MIGALVAAVSIARAHPLCYLDDSNPLGSVESVYCPNEQPDGFCCGADVEAGVQTTVEGSGATDTCAELYKEVCIGSDRCIMYGQRTQVVVVVRMCWGFACTVQHGGLLPGCHSRPMVTLHVVRNELKSSVKCAVTVD